MRVIGDLGADGGIYSALEFSGDGITALSLESRMVLPNMMAECGAKNAYLAPDDAVFDYLATRYAARMAREGTPVDPDAARETVIGNGALPGCRSRLCRGASLSGRRPGAVHRVSAFGGQPCAGVATGRDACAAGIFGDLHQWPVGGPRGGGGDPGRAGMSRTGRGWW